MSQWNARPYSARQSSYGEDSVPVARNGSLPSWQQQSSGQRTGSSNGYNQGHRFSQSQQLPSAGSTTRTASPGHNSNGHRASASSAVVTHSHLNGSTVPPMDKVNAAQAPPGSMHDKQRVIELLSGRKFYCEGYIKKAIDLGADGRPPNHGDPLAQWDDWFAQLTGSELSLWNVEQMNKAAAAGTTVPPTYLKINDSFVTFVDLNPRKAQGGGPPPDAPWVFALNNAGSNRILFACSDEIQHRRWLNALRLAEWEVSRLSEIYTATLFGLRKADFYQRTPLSKGSMEGAIDVRLPGETEWSKAYLVLNEGGALDKQKRRSSLLQSFSGFASSSSSRNISKDALGLTSNASHAAFYASKRSKKPFLIMHHLLTVYAVYPEAPKLFYESTLAKVEGAVEWDDSAEMPRGFELNVRRRDVRDGGRAGGQSALLFMPEDISRDGHARMLEWILGFCDTFKHFGRGRTVGARSPFDFEFDPRKSSSPYYSYPIGPAREQLFFAPSAVENMDIYERRPEQIRAALQDMLVQRMRRQSSVGPAPPAGYLENGIPARSPTAQTPQLDTIGESGHSRPNSLANELDAAPAPPLPSPKPQLSLDTGKSLAPALPPASGAYRELSAFSPVTATAASSGPPTALSASIPASAALAPIIASGETTVRRSLSSDRRVPVVKQEIIESPKGDPVPGGLAGVNTLRIHDSPVPTTRADSTENGTGSYDSVTQRDMLAALDFVQQTTPETDQRASPDPGIMAPAPHVYEQYRRPPSVASSAPTSRHGAEQRTSSILQADEHSTREISRAGASYASSGTGSGYARSRQSEDRERPTQQPQTEAKQSVAPVSAPQSAPSARARPSILNNEEDDDEDDEDYRTSEAHPPVSAPLPASTASMLAASTSAALDSGRRSSGPRALPAVPSGAASVNVARARQTSPYLDQPTRQLSQGSVTRPLAATDTSSALARPERSEMGPREAAGPAFDMPVKPLDLQSSVSSQAAVPLSERERHRDPNMAAPSARPVERRDPLHRHSSQGPPPPQPYGMPGPGYNPYGMQFPGYGMPGSGGMPYMPWMMDPQAFQAAQMAAHQAFMSAMMSYSQQPGAPGMTAPVSPVGGTYPAQFSDHQSFMPPSPGAAAVPGPSSMYGSYSGAPPPLPHHYAPGFGSQSMMNAGHGSGPPAGAGHAVRTPSLNGGNFTSSGSRYDRDGRD